MSNIHEVDIQASVPFDWMNHLPDHEAACFTSSFLSPSGGLNIDYEDEGFVPNHDGSKGMTSMYRIFIYGQEGVSTGYLERIASAIARLEGVTVHRARARDVQFSRGRWYDLDTTRPEMVPCPGCGVRTLPRPTGDDALASDTGVMTNIESWSFVHKGRCPIREEIQNDPAVKAASPRITSTTRKVAGGVEVTQFKIDPPAAA